MKDIKVVENTHTQMERRRDGQGGGEWKDWRWHVINRWSDKFKCFSS